MVSQIAIHANGTHREAGIDYDSIAESDSTERIEQSGWHKPERKKSYDRMAMRRDRKKWECGCELVTDKGAYRDEIYELDSGAVIYYLHQSPIVVQHGDSYRLDSCGYQTRTTRKRMNKNLPFGYRVRQRSGDWFVSLPDDTEVEFEDGMIVDTA